MSSGKRRDPGSLPNALIYNFSGLKYIKKGYIEMTKKIYLGLLKSVLGRSVFHYFPVSQILSLPILAHKC